MVVLGFFVIRKIYNYVWFKSLFYISNASVSTEEVENISQSRTFVIDSVPELFSFYY